MIRATYSPPRTGTSAPLNCPGRRSGKFDAEVEVQVEVGRAADIVAAKAVQADIAEEFARYGVKPPGDAL